MMYRGLDVFYPQTAFRLVTNDNLLGVQQKIIGGIVKTEVLF